LIVDMLPQPKHVEKFSFLHTFKKTNCFDGCYIWNHITITFERLTITFKVQGYNTSSWVTIMWYR